MEFLHMNTDKPIKAEAIAESRSKTLYPEPFAALMDGRSKRKLGDHFGLENFGINLTKLSPGAMSALKHRHLKQDEFIYILSGTPTLVYGEKEYEMAPGDCFGFKCNNGVAHHLVNNSNSQVVYLEIGDRTPGDQVEYPDDDLLALSSKNGSWAFLHKDGTPY
jgi:uncharacterized cupin superfamily protein